MKFLKLSLAASVALGALSTASFAQPLEDAIKGIDVSGYLRYRFNSDYYDNYGKTTDQHRWKAVADFKAPVGDNLGLNFGILYNNESNNVHHTSLGSGLGSGKDGSFGVSTFNGVITPDSTATTIILGKQRLATPVTNAGDDDRGTGILALNSDLEGFTFAAGAFDSFSIDDLALTRGYQSGNNDGGSVTKPLYALAGIYSLETDFGNIGAQLWGFYIQDIVDGLGVLDLSWNDATFNATIKYAIASINNDADNDVFAALHPSVVGTNNLLIGNNPNKANIAGANDLFLINLGADFTKEYDLPLDAKIGYAMNFQDGTAVTLNDDGNIFTDTWAGAIWWQNDITGFSTSALLPRGIGGFGTEQELKVFYGAVGYKMIDERLRIGLDFVWGNNSFDYDGRTFFDRDFMEITPRVSWKHNKNLTISGFFAYLTTDVAGQTRSGLIEDPDTGIATPWESTARDDQTRERTRIEVKYSF